MADRPAESLAAPWMSDALATACALVHGWQSSYVVVALPGQWLGVRRDGGWRALGAPRDGEVGRAELQAASALVQWLKRRPMTAAALLHGVPMRLGSGGECGEEVAEARGAQGWLGSLLGRGRAEPRGAGSGSGAEAEARAVRCATPASGAGLASPSTTLDGRAQVLVSGDRHEPEALALIGGSGQLGRVRLGRVPSSEGVVLVSIESA